MVIKYLSKNQLALLEKIYFTDVRQIGKILPAVEDDNTVYTISKNNIEKILKEKLVVFENAINENVKVKLAQHEFDALISFIFNIGISNFKKSSVLKKVNEGTKDISKYFDMWNKASGSPREGV